MESFADGRVIGAMITLAVIFLAVWGLELPGDLLGWKRDEKRHRRQLEDEVLNEFNPRR